MFQRIEFACASVLLGAVVILVGIASIARGFGMPIIWSIEVAQLMFLWLVILAVDLAMQGRRHFGMQILLDNVPPGLRRAMEICNLLALIGFLIFLLYYAWGNVILMHPRLDGALQIRGSWFHASMVVGFALLVRTLVVQLIERLRRGSAT